MWILPETWSIMGRRRSQGLQTCGCNNKLGSESSCPNSIHWNHVGQRWTAKPGHALPHFLSWAKQRGLHSSLFSKVVLTSSIWWWDVETFSLIFGINQHAHYHSTTLYQKCSFKKSIKNYNNWKIKCQYFQMIWF